MCATCWFYQDWDQFSTFFPVHSLLTWIRLSSFRYNVAITHLIAKCDCGRSFTDGPRWSDVNNETWTCCQCDPIPKKEKTIPWLMMINHYFFFSFLPCFWSQFLMGSSSYHQSMQQCNCRNDLRQLYLGSNIAIMYGTVAECDSIDCRCRYRYVSQRMNQSIFQFDMFDNSCVWFSHFFSSFDCQ